jgi:hypothetical protein
MNRTTIEWTTALPGVRGGRMKDLRYLCEEAVIAVALSGLILGFKLHEAFVVYRRRQRHGRR